LLIELSKEWEKRLKGIKKRAMLRAKIQHQQMKTSPLEREKV